MPQAQKKSSPPTESYVDRKYLTEDEVKKLIAATKNTRNPIRNHALVLLMFRHGFRIGEVIKLQWHDIDFNRASLSVARLKNGVNTTHPIQGDVLRLLRALKRENNSCFVFVSEQGAPLARSSAIQMIELLGKSAELPFPINSHMLRHACGYALANKGVDTRTLQEYMGHKNIQNTVIYTQLSPNRFKNLWD